MKRDLELIRNILIRIEEQPANAKITTSTFSDLSSDSQLINLHIALLADRDMIECKAIPTMGKMFNDFWIFRMTDEGYNYLESIRDNQIWEKTKSKFIDAGISMPMDIVKSTAIKIISGLLS